MRERRDDAYVLGTRELGEADVIVTLLGREAGRIRGVAAGARKSRKRFGGALEPLTLVGASWSEREGRELHRIHALELRRSYAAMQSEPERQAAAAIVCEIAAAVARDGESDPREFRLVGALADALEAGVDPWVAVRYFEYWTLRLHGVLPEPGEEGAAALGRVEREALSAFSSGPPAAAEELAKVCRPRGKLARHLRGALERFVERTLRTYRHLEALTA